MATIQDVAKRAGVAAATVSRVLGAPGAVAKETRDRVEAAIAELGYIPNFAAKSLRTKRAGKIVVTVPDIANPFFSEIIKGLGEVAKSAGFAVLLGDTRHDREVEEGYAAMLLRKEADGLIFLGHRLPDTLNEMIARLGAKAPIVNGCEFSPDLGVPSVHIDNAAAAADMVRHLAGLGHRQVGIVTGPLESPLSRDRLEGVRSVPGIDFVVAQGDFSIESGVRAAAELLNGRDVPTAFFCFSDEMAIGALAAIRQQGLSCPADISVAGFDDIHVARYLDPALTTVYQPTAEIGRAAARLLIEILSDEGVSAGSITLPHQIAVRRSTGPCLA